MSRSKPTPFIIIDGYNLMHAAGLASLRYGPGELEKARNRLVALVARPLSEKQRGRTMIVFDAAGAPAGPLRRSRQKGMEILYAPAGGDADTVIEELIAGHSAPRQIRLVSSDHRLQKAARKRRAAFLDSEAFVAELQRAGESETAEQPQAPGPKFGGDVPAAETDAWLQEFGEIPEAADLQRESGLNDSELDKLQSEVDRWAEEFEENEDPPNG